MALNDLLAALEREAEQRIVAERAAAELAAERTVREAAARLAVRREEALARDRATLETGAAREVALASRDAEHTVLTAREAVLARVLGLVQDGLARQPLGAGELPVLAALAEAALAHAGDRPARIRCTPELAPALVARIGDRVRVEADPALHAGSTVVTEDGRLSIDASLLGRLAAREAEARILILARLEAPA